jgi:hypothetical protein
MCRWYAGLTCQNAKRAKAVDCAVYESDRRANIAEAGCVPTTIRWRFAQSDTSKRQQTEKQQTEKQQTTDGTVCRLLS